MTRRERVIAALSHKQTDFVPYHTDFTLLEQERITKESGNPNYLAESGIHLHGAQFWGYPEEKGKAGYFTDDFGVTWNRSGIDKDIGVIDNCMIMEEDIGLYKTPYLNEKRLRAELDALVVTKGDQFTFAGIGFSMFERLWSYCGMENALIFMLSDPSFTHTLLDRICEFNCKVIDIINEYDLDGFYFGDDWGQQKGLIMGASLWREFIKPRMRTMYDRARKKGKFILQHSCGDIHEIMPDLIDIGLTCYQTFQPEIYDIANIKREYGKDLCFWGGISAQQLLPYGTPQQVTDTVRRTIDILGKGGGYIAAPAHAVSNDVPFANIDAMMKVFQNQ